MKHIFKLFCPSICFAAWMSVAQAAVILDTIYVWSPDGSEADQTGRLVRNTVQSVWGSVKPNPGLFSSTVQDYMDFMLNSLAFDQIQVTIEQLTDHNIYSVSYSLYNPADPTSGYLADAGGSSGIPPSPFFYQFDIAPSTDFTVVISTVNGVGSGANGSTRVLVEGFNAIPEPASMLLLGGGLLALSLIGRRRFRRS